MPEGDTLHRTATVLHRAIVGDTIRAARGRPGGAQLERTVGTTVLGVRTIGKHLLIEFANGLTLHTHLRMTGSWHRYRPGERWREDASAAVAVLESDRAVAVCFDAPTVELLDSRALSIHPVLSRLGPDLLDPGLDMAEAYRRLILPREVDPSIAEALLDQRIVAGIGNVYRSEILFIERVDPFTRVTALARADSDRILGTASRLLRANLEGGDRVTMPDALGAQPGSGVSGRRDPRRWVYGRAGRPCRRCGTPIRSISIGALPRRLFWCPGCQAPGRVG